MLAADQALARLEEFSDPPADIAAAMQSLRRPSCDLARELGDALSESLPLMKREGGFVREGYESALDEARKLRDDSRLVVAAMQARYAEETGVKTLKIRHNNVLGYFVEVTAQHGDRLMSAPLNATFIHRQTLAGQVRFTTSELGEIEARIANAGDRALGLELEIFDRLAEMAVRTATTYATPRTPSRNWTSRRRSRSSRSTRTTPGRRSITHSASPSKAGGIRWSSRR